MVTCYPVAGKQKSVDICRAFADGCDGTMANGHAGNPDAAFFYGVDASNEEIWKTVRREGIPFYYCDNSYFDETRQAYFRVTRNNLQHDGSGESNGYRFRMLGIEVKPWRKVGEHIVVCPQSPHFMNVIAGLNFDWLQMAIRACHSYSNRKLRIRSWSSDKTKLSKTLPDDLDGAHALVTWSSAAAVTAIVRGVPAISMGPSAAMSMGGDIRDVEMPPMPDRTEWLGVLADNQWTLDEMRRGMAWQTLQ